MPAAEAFSYAVLRLVPRVERGERINVGVVVFCRPLGYLAARTALDERRALALDDETRGRHPTLELSSRSQRTGRATLDLSRPNVARPR